ncbi:MAG: bacillithiol biosynthesis cysteine-adding enzyme BshC [Fluviicola sp.]|nr:MAG: bacillithiol biosynthesis cysteine-adding enzyme BshC [Fluviicola sp.]
MQIEKIKRTDTTYFSKTANDLVYSQGDLNKYIEAPYTLEEFKNQIKKKSSNFSARQREVLVDQLMKQHEDFKDLNSVQSNIQSLSKENTFTVTTGHQLNLFGGPLYVAYKIAHVIRLAEKLKETYPDYNFVPVFWMASEDHDFEEINHIHLFNDKISWDTDKKGAVGRFELNDIDDFKEQLLEKFGNNESFSEYLNQFYSDKDKNLAAATRRFVLDLFGDKGLVTLDGDSKELKELFSPVIKEELKKGFSGEAVSKTTEMLLEDGYKDQVHPREINLFYLSNQSRERIIKNDDGSYTAGDKSWKKDEILDEVESKPERFSPNVILRPVYQETILPNLSYLGGGGEMAYWLQLKGVFDHLNLTYPLIAVRNSIQIFDGISQKKMKKLDLSPKDMFKSIHENKKQFVLEQDQEELDFSEIESVGEELISKMEGLVSKVDRSLEAFAKSESVKINKQMDHLKQKLIRHQKKQHDDAMNQMENLYERLFPRNGLQERFETIIPLLAKHGKQETINILFNSVDPFEKDLILLLEE